VTFAEGVYQLTSKRCEGLVVGDEEAGCVSDLADLAERELGPCGASGDRCELLRRQFLGERERAGEGDVGGDAEAAGPVALQPEAIDQGDGEEDALHRALHPRMIAQAMDSGTPIH
jgi:hypothetical protein